MKKNELNIENFLSNDKFTSREELVRRTGLTDRAIREKISNLKTKRVVIYSSSQRGYKLAKEYTSMTKEERIAEKERISHSLNDCKARTKKLNQQKRKYIAYLKKAEQIDQFDLAKAAY